MLLEAETNKYCPGGNDIGAISNLITWVLNFFLSAFGKSLNTLGFCTFFFRFLKSIGWYRFSYGFLVVLNVFHQCFV